MGIDTFTVIGYEYKDGENQHVYIAFILFRDL